MPEPLPGRRSDRQLIAILRRHGELDRTQLARLSGLARSTIADAVTRLCRDGVLVERPSRPTGTGKVGRPAMVLAVAAPAGLVGVLALSHGTFQAAVAGFDGTIHGVRSVAVYADELLDGPIDPGLQMLEGALADAGLTLETVACAVIGVPLPFRPGQGAAWRARRPPTASPEHNELLPPLAWPTTDPAAALGARLGVPAWGENDANLGALGEATFGAAQGMTNLIYVKIVEGIGAGIVVNGQLVRGASGLAGELGHLHLRDDGPVCTCGGRGCLITQFPTPLLIDTIQPAHSDVLTLDDVLALAAAGDPGVHRVLSDLGRTIGRSLADFCVYLNPEGIILDAMLGPASDAVATGIREALHRYAPPLVAADVQILPGQLNQRAEILGAVVLARTKQAEPIFATRS